MDKKSIDQEEKSAASTGQKENRMKLDEILKICLAEDAVA